MKKIKHWLDAWMVFFYFWRHRKSYLTQEQMKMRLEAINQDYGKH